MAGNKWRDKMAGILINLEFMPFGKHTGKKLTEVPKNYLLWLKGNDVLEKEENKALKGALEKLNLI